MRLTDSGGLYGNCDSHDEDTNWFGAVVDTWSVQPARDRAGNYLSAGRIGYHDVVCVCYW